MIRTVNLEVLAYLSIILVILFGTGYIVVHEINTYAESFRICIRAGNDPVTCENALD